MRSLVSFNLSTPPTMTQADIAGFLEEAINNENMRRRNAGNTQWVYHDLAWDLNIEPVKREA